MRLSVLPGKDQPVQMIRASGSQDAVPPSVLPSERHPEAVEELMQEAFSEPFDLVQGPLYRVNVLRRCDDHLLALTIHHAIADGWSLGAFVQICAPLTCCGRQENRETSTTSALLPPGAPQSEPSGRVARSISIFLSGDPNWRKRSDY